ncbi:uncharacterized protein LOC129596018 [Paramacrobiotus metropolitanus]|uniref:uncharacterized protein LOC129596018 n=1 Tax=Paramacrobiotus metropolitanus TaxID=2943436 RepID=UPI002445C244|nr:uncharacterized protein LOC129596018 [Paramacrobiotus metropolitanus]
MFACKHAIMSVWLIVGWFFCVPQTVSAVKPIACKACSSSHALSACGYPVKMADLASNNTELINLYSVVCFHGCAQQIFTDGRSQYVAFGCVDTGSPLDQFGLNMTNCPSSSNGQNTAPKKMGRFTVSHCFRCDEDDCNDPAINSPVRGAPRSWPPVEANPTGIVARVKGILKSIRFT